MYSNNAPNGIDLDVSAVITGDATTGINKSGSGTLALDADNSATFAGTTTVQVGTLDVTATGALGTGSVTVNDPSSLQLASGITLSNQLTLNSSSIDAVESCGGDSTLGGSITLAQTTTFSVDSETLTLGSSIDAGGFAMVASGAGILLVSSTVSNSGGGVTVDSGATLGGDGTIGGVTVDSGGTLEPGSPSATAVLSSTGDVSFDSGATFSVTLGGVAPGTQYGQLDVAGTTDLDADSGAGATLAVSLAPGFIPKPGTQYVIISASVIPDNFSGLPDGSTVMAGTYPFVIHYQADSVTLTAQARVDTWEGGGGTGDVLWSDPANWSGGYAPSTYDSLVFPGDSYPTASNNDLTAGTEFTSIEIDAYGLRMSGNAIVLDGGITATYSVGTVHFALDTTLNADQTFTVASGGTLDLTGMISGSHVLTKAGAGTMGLSGANTYAGGTTINDGVVALQNSATAFGSGTVQINSDSIAMTRGEVSISSTSVLQIQNAFVLNSSDVGGDPVIENTDGTNVLGGTIDLAADATVDVAGSSILDFSGAISGAFGLTEVDAGRLVMGASNSYGGGTIVNAGQLAVDTPNDALGTGPVSINNAAQMMIFNEVYFLTSPVVDNDITLNTTSAAAIEEFNGLGTLTGSITLAQRAMIAADPGATLIIQGAIGDGSPSNDIGFTKTAGGMLQLAGTSTYTGVTTVSGGTLEVDGDISTSSEVDVTSGAILGGSGTVGSVVSTGGIVAPADAPNVLHTGSFSLDGNSTYTVQLDGTSAGGVNGYDQVIASGAVSLGGATLSATVGGSYTPTLGDQLTIIQNNGGLDVSGAFSGLPEGAKITIGGYDFEISYRGGLSQQDVVLTAKATPTITVNAAPNPSQLGQSVMFSVNVTGGGPTPTGTVQFYDGDPSSGGQPIGTPQTLDGSGQASVSTGALSVGTHQIYASYSGDGTYFSDTDLLTGGQVVTPDVTTTSVSSAQPSTTYGDQAIFTALVSAAFGGTPTGTVEFFDGMTDIGTGTLNSIGVATFTTTTLSATGSPHMITAEFEGSLSSQGSTSACYWQTITAADLTITADSMSKTYGDTVTFDGTEFSTAGLVNGDTVDSVNLSSFGAADTAAVAELPYDITASNATGTGLGNYTITYVPGQLTVNTAALTITADSASKTYGDTVTFDGTEFSAAGLVNGDTVNSATLSSAGAAGTATVAGSPYTIIASNAVGTGLGNYAISYVPGHLVVTPAALIITANDQTSPYGAPNSTLTATYSGFVNGDTPASLTTPVILSTTATSSSPVASYPIVAANATSPNYAITFHAGTLTVTMASSLTTLATPTGASVVGQAVSFTVHVGPGPNLATGSVNFIVDGIVAASMPVDSVTGLATWTTTSLGMGSHTISAAYAGNADVVASRSSVIQEVVNQANSQSGLDSHVVRNRRGQIIAVALDAAVLAVSPGSGLPTGVVTFFQGQRRLGKAMLNGGTAELAVKPGLVLKQGGTAGLAVKPGLVLKKVVTVSYSGDANFLSSVSPKVRITKQSITATARPSAAFYTGSHSRIARPMARHASHARAKCPGPPGLVGMRSNRADLFAFMRDIARVSGHRHGRKSPTATFGEAINSGR